MKNILVAGAGHGGLSAAAILAKNGYNVTVLEKSRREDIGHDWHDAMDIPALPPLLLFFNHSVMSDPL